MQTLVFPSNFELTAILQDLLPELVLDDPLIGGENPLFPIDSTDRAKIQWEQLDNFTGLTQLRGVDGEPGRVKNVGLSTFEMDPGYYGDVSTITEEDMTKWRKPGDPTAPWNLDEICMIREGQLLNRAIWRIKQVLWALATAGTFSVASPTGILHTDTFAIQTYASVVAWSTTATATPLADFRNIRLLHRGHSVKFNQSAAAYMNLKTFNYMTANTNTADLFGKRVGGLETAEGLDAINYVLMKEDLPKIVVYDEGYLDDSGTFQPYIPDNKVVVVGKRPGNARLGRAIFTRNASALPGGPGLSDTNIDKRYDGFVMKIVDKGEIMAVGRAIDMGLGFNWGPTIEYPSAVVSMDVTAH